MTIVNTNQLPFQVKLHQSTFISLCLMANHSTIQSNAFHNAVEDAIKETQQGKDCIEILTQYKAGLITFTEFTLAFVESALSFTPDELKKIRMLQSSLSENSGA